jgi:chaperonin cofactor prefoldin
LISFYIQAVKIKKDYIAFALQSKESRKSKITQLDSQIANTTTRIKELDGTIHVIILMLIIISFVNRFTSIAIKTEAEALEKKINAAKLRRNHEDALKDLPRRHGECKKKIEDYEVSVGKLNSRIATLRSALDHLSTLKDVEEGAAFLALLRDKPILKETLDIYEEFKQTQVENDISEPVEHTEAVEPEPDYAIEVDSTVSKYLDDPCEGKKT